MLGEGGPGQQVHRPETGGAGERRVQVDVHEPGGGRGYQPPVGAVAPLVGAFAPHPRALPVGTEDVTAERVGHRRRALAQRHVDGDQHAADGVVERAAQGIHQPLPRSVRGALPPPFFAEHRVVGPGGTEDAEDHLLGRHIGLGGEVPAPLVDTDEPPPVQVAHHVRTGTRRGGRDAGVVKIRK